jgi:hypothetical protein
MVFVSSAAQRLVLVLATALAYGAAFFLNRWAFPTLELLQDVSWLYLPAGLRVVFVLLFGLEGALGIAVACILISSQLYYPARLDEAVVAGLIVGFLPWVVRLVLIQTGQLQGDLSGLSARALLAVSVIFAGSTALVLQGWHLYVDGARNYWQTVSAMFVGDVVGTIVVLYLFKLGAHYWNLVSHERDFADTSRF